jgi:hypothetical protein
MKKGTSARRRKNVSKDGRILTHNHDAEDLGDVIPEVIGKGFGFVEVVPVPK